MGEEKKINSEYKSTLFAMLLSSEEFRPDLLGLYNVLNGSDYTDPGEIEITTIENVRKIAREDALEEGSAEGRAEGLAAGKSQTLLSLVEKGIITAEVAAKELDLSIEEVMGRIK